MNDTTSPSMQEGIGKALLSADRVDIATLLSQAGDPDVVPPKFYRIGEVVQHSGFSRQTIHNYTAMGLIRESQWTQKGHRLYDAEVFRQLAVIKRLKDQYSLAQIKGMFERAMAV
jgi:hypothetical protein